MFKIGGDTPDKKRSEPMPSDAEEAGEEPIERYKNSESEKNMREAFRAQVQGILKNEERFIKFDKKIRVGFEVELGLIDRFFKQVPEVTRNEIIDKLPFADKELGASQVEIRTDPITLFTIDDIFQQLEQREGGILQRAKDEGVFVVRGGINPFISPEDVIRTNKTKYQLVPNFHNRFRSPFVPRDFGKLEKIDPRNAGLVALFQSVQCNIQAESFADAVEKLNYSYMIAPAIIAVGGNSRFIDGKDLGIPDARMPLWEISHDVRTKKEILQNKSGRVGKYDRYVTSIEDYFEQVGSFPFILDDKENALKIGIGLFWKDVRIKIIGDSLVVEFRPISTQPTPVEDVAMHTFYIGRLIYAQKTKEPFIDIKFVNENREAAMMLGLNAELFYLDKDNILRKGNARDIVRNELEKAREGLELANIKGGEKYLSILERRLEIGSPSDVFANAFYKTVTTEGRTMALVNGFKAARSINDINQEHKAAKKIEY